MVSWARSATKHGVPRVQSAFVIEHCGLMFRVPAPAGQRDDRLVFLGDDEHGVALEVMAVELDDEQMHVIHAMGLRKRYRPQYEEAKRWRI